MEPVPAQRRDARRGTLRARVAVVALAGILGTGAAAAAAAAAPWAPDAADRERIERGEVVVHARSDAARSPGAAVQAAVRIEAPAHIVRATLTDCGEALRFVPHLQSCVVLDSAPDGSWQLIEHEVDARWYLPAVRYVFRVEQAGCDELRVSNVSGDLARNDGAWRLEPVREAAATIVRYEMHVAPRFHVPRWIVRRLLASDVPEMLRALRERSVRAWVDRQLRPPPAASNIDPRRQASGECRAGFAAAPQ